MSIVFKKYKWGAFALESTPLKMRGAFSFTSIFLFNPLQDSSMSSLTRLMKYTIVYASIYICHQSYMDFNGDIHCISLIHKVTRGMPLNDQVKS